MAWHDDPAAREDIGKEIERRFAHEILCLCGGQFMFVGDTWNGRPDFMCRRCGLEVDTKKSDEDKGVVNLSSTPYDNYSDDVRIVTLVGGLWRGAVKRDIRLIDTQPLSPAHQSGGYLPDTPYYRASLSNFGPLRLVGLDINPVYKKGRLEQIRAQIIAIGDAMERMRYDPPEE